MLILAHAGGHLMPQDLWSAWTFDPFVIIGLAVAAALYWQGAGRRNRPQPRRTAYFAAGLAVVAIAVLSPIDAVSDVLVSVHMVQHLLLILVAAPLLVMGDMGTVMAGVPRGVRKPLGRWRHRSGLTPARYVILRHPVTILLVSTGAIWFWHASLAYEAAVANPVIHSLEHFTFLMAGALFWNGLLSPRPSSRVPQGARIFLIFAVAMQGVILSALLTFGDAVWYPSYLESAPAWNVDPVDDQRLAGLIMWIPGGILYTTLALRSVAGLLRQHAEPLPERAPGTPEQTSI